MGTNKLPSYPLRMEQDLRSQLDEIAKANGRSMNAEIVHRLEESLAPVSSEPNDQYQAMYKMVFTAFQKTSNDFSKEVNERMGLFIGKLIEQHIADQGGPASVTEEPKTETLTFPLEDFVGKAGAEFIRSSSGPDKPKKPDKLDIEGESDWF